jgi:hypothetical protein
MYMLIDKDNAVMNSFYYILQDGFALFLLLDLLKNHLYSKHLICSSIVFTLEHLLFNLSLINKPKVYYEMITSMSVTITFVASVVITFIIVSLFESGKWKING